MDCTTFTKSPYAPHIREIDPEIEQSRAQYCRSTAPEELNKRIVSLLETQKPPPQHSPTLSADHDQNGLIADLTYFAKASYAIVKDLLNPVVHSLPATHGPHEEAYRAIVGEDGNVACLFCKGEEEAQEHKYAPSPKTRFERAVIAQVILREAETQLTDECRSPSVKSSKLEWYASALALNINRPTAVEKPYVPQVMDDL